MADIDTLDKFESRAVRRFERLFAALEVNVKLPRMNSQDLIRLAAHLIVAAELEDLNDTLQRTRVEE